MARMFGFIGNRADLGAMVLEAHAAVLRVKRAPEEPLGWGVGFYQAGEVLLRRRPLDDRAVIDLAEAAADVRTDVLLGHVRKASVGALRTENTHPFRYRSWLWAETGTIGGFDRLRERLLEALPEFLRRNVRGETDSELSFYLFLSFLHDAGELEHPHVGYDAIAAALRASVALVDRLSAEEGMTQNAGNVLVTNGERMVALHRSGTMALRVFKGRYDVESLSGEDGVRRARIPSIDSTHCTMIASDLSAVPEGFRLVEPKRLVSLTRSEDPVIETL